LLQSRLSPPTDTDAVPLRRYRYGVSPVRAETTVVDDQGRVSTYSYRLSNDPADAWILLEHSLNDGSINREYAYNSPISPALPTLIRENGLQITVRYDAAGRPLALRSPTRVGYSASVTPTTPDIDGDGQPDPYQLYRITTYNTDSPDPETRPAARYTYDALGHVQTLQPGGGPLTTIATREERFGLPQTVTLALTDEVTRTLQLTYDQRGYLIARDDGRSVERFTWDVYGRLLSYRQTSDQTLLSAYDMAYTGDCTRLTDETGTTTRTCYDERDRLVRRQVLHWDRLLRQVDYGYDVQDRLIREAHSVGDDMPPHVTTYAYAVAADGGWQRITTHPDGLTERAVYDAADRLIAHTDTLGRTTTYAYDETTITRSTPDGLQASLETSLSGRVCAVDYGDLAWTLGYVDDSGRACGGSDAAGRRLRQLSLGTGDVTLTFAAYDAAGRPTEVVFSVRRPADDDPRQRVLEESVLRYAYDAQGRLIEASNVTAGTTRRFIYDDLPEQTVLRVFDEGQPDAAIRYTYDLAGRLIQVESALGRIDYAYTPRPETGLLAVDMTATADGDALQTSRLLYDGLGRVVAWETDDQQTALTYDQRSRLLRVEVTGADGQTLSARRYVYNAADQVTLITDERGQEYRYVYNQQGLLTTERDFDDVVTVYNYSADGRLRAVVDATGSTTNFDYDARGHLTEIVDAKGRTVRFDPSGLGEGVLITSAENSAITYTFDLMGRLWQIDDAHERPHRLSYDATGRLSRWSPWADAQTTRYSYTAGGQLADGGKQRVGSDILVALGLDELNARIEQFLLGVQHVQHGARTDLGFALHAFQRDLGGLDLVFQRLDAGGGGHPCGIRILLGLDSHRDSHRRRDRCRRRRGPAGGHRHR